MLSLLDPQLSWDEAEVQASVQAGVQVTKADGSPLSPYDLKRLQVRILSHEPLPHLYMVFEPEGHALMV